MQTISLNPILFGFYWPLIPTGSPFHMETQSDPSILPALNSWRSSTLRAPNSRASNPRASNPRAPNPRSRLVQNCNQCRRILKPSSLTLVWLLGVVFRSVEEHIWETWPQRQRVPSTTQLGVAMMMMTMKKKKKQRSRGMVWSISIIAWLAVLQQSQEKMGSLSRFVSLSRLSASLEGGISSFSIPM